MKENILAQRFAHNDNIFFLCLLKADILTKISYVSRRGIDDEEGAIQRILNKQRIKGIRDFILDGTFLNNIILIFLDNEKLCFKEEENKLSFEPSSRIAQIIDGQHRIEGLKEALKQDNSIKNILIPAVLSRFCHFPQTCRCKAYEHWIL